MKEYDSLRELEIKYLGRKGELTEILRGLASLALEEKKTIGSLANEIKKEIENSFEKARVIIKNREIRGALKKEWIDITEPSLRAKELGHLHPLTQVQNEIEDIFTSMGFMVLDGPELESEYYNFEALNIPSWHPARDMQDTFYVESSKLGEDENRLVMRTHTSPVQVRAMQKYGAPIRAIVPGRCFRNEATDVRHEHTFSQIEGFMIDKNISISNMIAVLELFAKSFFGKDTKIRMRPKFYPFVEPGTNGEVSCSICYGKGCRLCKYTGWLEILGCGLIHPNVLKAGGIDTEKYSGFAFGFGFSRIAQLKYGFEDGRLFNSGDLRLLKQF
ncbi:MAG: phenylalanine--tRNA ligase subunit alpha [bacterium]